jgi:hypothetical protein
VTATRWRGEVWAPLTSPSLPGRPGPGRAERSAGRRRGSVGAKPRRAYLSLPPRKAPSVFPGLLLPDASHIWGFTAAPSCFCCRRHDFLNRTRCLYRSSVRPQAFHAQPVYPPVPLDLSAHAPGAPSSSLRVFPPVSPPRPRRDVFLPLRPGARLLQGAAEPAWFFADARVFPRPRDTTQGKPGLRENSRMLLPVRVVLGRGRETSRGRPGCSSGEGSSALSGQANVTSPAKALLCAPRGCLQYLRKVFGLLLKSVKENRATKSCQKQMEGKANFRRFSFLLISSYFLFGSLGSSSEQLDC